VGFERIKKEYESCLDFEEIVCVKRRGDSEINDFLHQDGYLFRFRKLCVLRTSLREYLVWELHAGGHAGHFGRKKTIEAVENLFYWPSIKKDIARLIGQYCTCNWLSNENIILACTCLYLCQIVPGRT